MTGMNMTLPNLLSAFRILSTPILLFLAYWGNSTVFLALLIAVLLPDTLYGWLARRLGKYPSSACRSTP